MKRPDGWAERYNEAYMKEYSGGWKGSPERAMFEAGASARHEADIEWLERRLAPRYSSEGERLDGWYLADEVWQCFEEIE